jgi:hypothetical protein
MWVTWGTLASVLMSCAVGVPGRAIDSQLRSGGEGVVERLAEKFNTLHPGISSKAPRRVRVTVGNIIDAEIPSPIVKDASGQPLLSKQFIKIGNRGMI